jgi:hypothetical protein
MELMGLCLCVYVKAMCKLMNSFGLMFMLWSMAKCEIWWPIGFVRLCLFVVVYRKALNFFDKRDECLWYMVKDVAKLNASFFKQSNNGCHGYCLSSLWATIIQSYVKMTFPRYLEVVKGFYYTPCPYEQPKNNKFFLLWFVPFFLGGLNMAFSSWREKLHIVQAIVEVVAGHMIELLF